MPSLAQKVHAVKSKSKLTVLSPDTRITSGFILPHPHAQIFIELRCSKRGKILFG